MQRMKLSRQDLGVAPPDSRELLEVESRLDESHASKVQLGRATTLGGSNNSSSSGASASSYVISSSPSRRS
eukprot:1193929-Amphidinium_carterae.2